MLVLKILRAIRSEITTIFEDRGVNKDDIIFEKFVDKIPENYKKEEHVIIKVRKPWCCKNCGNHHDGIFHVKGTPVYVCPVASKKGIHKTIRIYGPCDVRMSDGEVVRPADSIGCRWKIIKPNVHPDKVRPKDQEHIPVHFVQCQAFTKKGQQCKNRPQHGHAYCGPHLNKSFNNA